MGMDNYQLEHYWTEIVNTMQKLENNRIGEGDVVIHDSI